MRWSMISLVRLHVACRIACTPSMTLNEARSRGSAWSLNRIKLWILCIRFIVDFTAVGCNAINIQNPPNNILRPPPDSKVKRLAVVTS